MEAFSDMMMILSVTLLAVVVAIFVFAASLLRSAIPEAVRQQSKIAEEQRDKFKKAVEEMQASLEAAGESGDVGKLEELKTKLQDYDRSRRQFDKASRRLAGRYQLLRVRRGVEYTAGTLLLALLLAWGAKVVDTSAWQYVLLGLCGLAVAWACRRIYLSLLTVESVALTPEDATQKTVEAFETAMERHEERKRPILNLKFIKAEPPFEFKPSSQQVIWFNVRLIQGDVARSTRVDFIAPEGFDFPGHEPYRRSLHATHFPGALTATFEIGDVLGGRISHRELNIKTPSKVGTYTLNYWLGGEGCIARFVPFEVKIAE
jgi:hypothetical protein